jgi:hypothetical protein
LHNCISQHFKDGRLVLLVLKFSCQLTPDILDVLKWRDITTRVGEVGQVALKGVKKVGTSWPAEVIVLIVPRTFPLLSATMTRVCSAHPAASHLLPMYKTAYLSLFGSFVAQKRKNLIDDTSKQLQAIH